MGWRELPRRAEAEGGYAGNLGLRRTARVGTALAAGCVALVLYAATLLPGQDLGDTASFQAATGDHRVTPRQAYPLYFALGLVATNVLPGEPARAANLVSAACGAGAVALLAGVAAVVSGSALAGLYAGLLFAGSYTFWSQSVIAEVYTLHLLVFGCSLGALLWWERRIRVDPGRHLFPLALFFSFYSLSFGNHLSSILLAPGFTFFLLATPERRRLVFRPRVMALAAAIAAAGSLQYAWNFSYALAAPERPEGLAQLLSSFWFDVTKADWRAAYLFGKEPSTYPSRLLMYLFDLRQQFGIAGTLAAVLGAREVFRRAPALGASLGLVYLVTWTFAFTYNVGDTHVFYLVPHMVVALWAGMGVASMARWLAGSLRSIAPGGGYGGTRSKARSASGLGVATSALLALFALHPAWRIFDTLPAVDRSSDRQAQAFLEELTSGLDGRNSIIVSNLNWQLQNGLDYYSRHVAPQLVVVPLHAVFLHFPSLVWNNWSAGRDVVLMGSGERAVGAAYEGLFAVVPDERRRVRPLSERLSGFPPGSIYLVSLLAPYPEVPLDEDDLDRALGVLAGGSVEVDSGRYVVLAGRIGSQPSFVRSSNRPFRQRIDVAGTVFDVRMESWLPPDTIRRAGFGHVIVNRRRLLLLDRGVSVLVVDSDSRPLAREYLGGLFAPQERHVVRPAEGSVLSLSGSASYP